MRFSWNSNFLILLFFFITSSISIEKFTVDDVNLLNEKLLYKKELKKNRLIKNKPNSLFFKNDSFFNDFEISAEEEINLLDYYPKSIFNLPSIASGSHRQFQINGKKNECFVLNISSQIKAIDYFIRDEIDRPVYSSSIIDELKNKSFYVAANNIYTIKIRYGGVLSNTDEFILFLHKVNDDFCNEIDKNYKINDIPLLRLEMTKSELSQFKSLTKFHRDKIQNIHDKNNEGMPITTLKQKFNGKLFYGDLKSNISISSSGAGDILHFSDSNPSFTIKVKSGNYFLGMKRFKLFNIESKEGLKDYIVGKIMVKEGVYHSRSKLINLFFDGNIYPYILEETYSNTFFANLKHHNANITSSFRNFFKNNSIVKNDIDYETFYPESISHYIDQEVFSKTIALAARFHSTHGIEGSEIRFFVDQISGKYIPVIRDLNVDHWANYGLGIRSFNTHSQWFMNDQFYTTGSIMTPFIYKNGTMNDNCVKDDSCHYVYTSRSIGFDGINAVIRSFIKNVNNRIKFEQYLHYFSNEKFIKTYQNIFSRIYNSNNSFQKNIKRVINKSKNIFDNNPKYFKENIDKFFNDSSVSIFSNNASKYGNIIILKGSLNEEYYIYNLTPFSISMSIKDIAKKELTCSPKSYLNPSPFYSFITNSLGENKYSVINLKTILNVEKTNEYLQNKSYTRICSNKILSKNFIKENFSFRLFDAIPISNNNILFQDDLKNNFSINYSVNLHNNNKIIFDSEKKISLLQFGQEVKNGINTLNYLILNNSDNTYSLNLQDLKNEINVFIKSPDNPIVLDEIKSYRITSQNSIIDDKTLVLKNIKLSNFKYNNLLHDQLDNFFISSDLDKELAILSLKFSFKSDVESSYEYRLKTHNKLGFLPKAISNQITNIPIETTINHINYLKSIDKDNIEDFQKDKIEVLKISNGKFFKPIIVKKNQRLVIEEGQTLQFSESSGLIIYGELQVLGTKSKPVKFYPINKSWKGIILSNSASEENIMKFVEIKNASGGNMNNHFLFGALTTSYSNLSISNLYVSKTTSIDAVNFYHSDIIIDSINISDSSDDALDSDWSNVSIKNSNFKSCGADCIDFNNSFFNVMNTNIDSAADKGISIGEGSYGTLDNIFINDIRNGVVIKDSSLSKLNDIYISEVKSYPLLTYVKKPEFGKPSVYFRNIFKDGILLERYFDDSNNVTNIYD